MKRLLTAAERKKGWVAFCCPEHGFLMAGAPSATVVCGEKVARGKRCNKKAIRVTEQGGS